ncbi:MAG TPA: DUF418 domain-containing protein [Cellvibrionaceae bacterium]
MQQSRVDLIDSLRGYALMGLFLIHMIEYYEVYWLNPIPHPLNSALFALFGGKAFAIFALLFGVSFFILLNNQQNRGVDFRARFIWRLGLLLAVGYVHSLLYGGDILQVLAICGVLLVPLWRAPQLVVLMLGVFFLLQGPVWLLAMWISYSADSAQPLFPQFDNVLRVYAEGSLGQLVLINALDGNARKWFFMLESGRLWTVIGMSLLGFWLARLQIFTQQAQSQKRFFVGLICCVLVAVPLFLAEDLIKSHYSSLKTQGVLLRIFNAYFNLALTLASVCIFVLLYQTRLQILLRYLAFPGRMTLSIYLAQSILCVPIFYGFGLAAWMYLGQVNSFLLGVFLWIAQILAARWWFKHYRYGPVEWLWRACTYTRSDIPFKRDTEV